MAKQITFHSVAAMPNSPSEGGIYFNHGHYDSGAAFGYNVNISGVIYKGAAKFGLDVSDVRVITESYTGGLVDGAGNTNSYITHITKDAATGFLTAHVKPFPTFNGDATTVQSTSNAVKVSVTTQSGAVTAVSVVTALKADASYKTSESNAVGISVKTQNGQVVGANVYTNLVATSSVVTSTSNDHSVTVSTVNGQVKSVVVAAPAKFSVADIGNGKSTSASGDTTVTVSTENGKVTKVVVAAPTRFALSEIPTATKSAYQNGVSVAVTTTKGSVTSVYLNGVGTAASKNFTDSMTSNGSNLPTESAVATYVDGKISNLGNVMEFKGVLTGESTLANP